MKRAEAIAAGLDRYSTGKPCANGHVAYRYTKSGTCSACVAASNAGRPAGPKTATAAPLNPELVEWVEHAVEQEVRIFPYDLPEFSDFVRWLCVARWPTVPPETFLQRPRGTDRQSGALWYVFRCHKDDKAAVFARSNELLHPPRDKPPVPDYQRMHREFDARDEAAGPYDRDPK